VKFPFELDALDICTPELKEKLLPANTKMKEIERDRRERRKIRRKTKKRVESAEGAGQSAPGGEDVPMADPSTAPTSSTQTDGAEPGTAVGAGAELEDENVYLEREKKEIDALVDEEIKRDTGASISGLYDLYGEFQFWAIFPSIVRSSDQHILIPSILPSPPFTPLQPIPSISNQPFAFDCITMHSSSDHGRPFARFISFTRETPAGTLSIMLPGYRQFHSHGRLFSPS
jgi:hypothetical protein